MPLIRSLTPGRLHTLNYCLNLQCLSPISLSVSSGHWLNLFVVGVLSAEALIAVSLHPKKACEAQSCSLRSPRNDFAGKVEEAVTAAKEATSWCYSFGSVISDEPLSCKDLQ